MIWRGQASNHNTGCNETLQGAGPGTMADAVREVGRSSWGREVLSTYRTRAGSSAKIQTWAAAHEAHVTTFHSANARVRSAR